MRVGDDSVDQQAVYLEGGRGGGVVVEYLNEWRVIVANKTKQNNRVLLFKIRILGEESDRRENGR